ncbi:MAG TPA: PAS domain-containing protein, partial [Terriglobales bacterium]|nr:PAS domain-containing protein [Terriglobales bacterium]
MAPSPLEQQPIPVGSASAEERFQHLLLRLANAALRDNEPATLIHFLCRETRRAFAASATFFCRIAPDGSFFAQCCDSASGTAIDDFRLRPEQAPSLSRPAQHRTALAIDDASQTQCAFASAAQARSLLAAPVVFAEEVAVLVVADQNLPYRFAADDARKISAVAAQAGLLLGASSVTRAARESRRRSELLVHCAQLLHATVDSAALCETLVEYVRGVFNAPVAALALTSESRAELVSINAAEEHLAATFRELYHSESGEWLRTLIEHACCSEGPAWFPVPDGPAAVLRETNFPLAEIICAPVRTAQRRGAVLALGTPLGAFTNQDLPLIATVAELGALALANCDLYTKANTQAEQLQRSLHSSTEEQRIASAFAALAAAKGRIAPNDFAAQLVSRVREATGARTAVLARPGGAVFEIAASADPEGELPAAAAWRLGSVLAHLARSRSEPVIVGRANELLGHTLATQLGWHDVAAARLSSSDGDLLAMLCVADPARSEHLHAVMAALARQGALAVENTQLGLQLTNSGRKWDALADSIRDLVLVHDDRYKVLRVNAATAELLNIKPHELTGVPMQALVTMLGDSARSDCRFCAGVSPGEQSITLFDRTYLVSTSELNFAEHGRELTHVLKDISDSQEAEQRYRELFDNVQEGVFFAVPGGRFVEVNDALVRMLGYASREELLLADPNQDIFFDYDTRASFQQELHDQGLVTGWLEPVRRKDGTIIHTLQNVFVVRDSRGTIVQHRGLMLDITDLRNSQVELERERDFTSRILENTRSMILVTTPEGTITYANPRGLEALHVTAGQVVGKNLLSFTTADRRRDWAEALRAAAAGQHSGSLDLQLAGEGGTTQPLSANISPVMDESRRVMSLVVVLTDLSETAALHSKLAQTEKLAAVGQLVSGVAHEVNNPLTAILGFSDLLLNDASLPDHAKKDLRVIMQEAQRTKTIVQNLLSFARQVPPQRESVNINDLLRKTVQLRAYDLNNRRISVNEHFTEPLPLIVADPHQLQQVFLNVLNNAFDAISELSDHGQIDITTSAIPAYV